MAILVQSLPGLGLTLDPVALMERDNVAARTGNLQEWAWSLRQLHIL